LPLPVEECVNIPASLKVISEIYLRDTDIDLLRTNVDGIPESVIVDCTKYPSDVMITALVQGIIYDVDYFSTLGYELIEAKMRTTAERFVDSVGLRNGQFVSYGWWSSKLRLIGLSGGVLNVQVDSNWGHCRLG
jgi:hypothetical protein